MNTEQCLSNFKGTQWESMSLEEIFEEFKSYVPKTINKQFPNRKKFLQAHLLDEDDIEQLGYIGLWEAIKNYDSSRGAKFETFVIDNIKWKINRMIRKYSLRNESEGSLDLASIVSIDCNLTDNEDSENYFEEILWDDSVDIEGDANFHLMISNIREVLSKEKNQKFAKKMEYFIISKYKGMTEEEIASNLGVTKQAINDFMKTKQSNRVKEKLKECLQ